MPHVRVSLVLSNVDLFAHVNCKMNAKRFSPMFRRFYVPKVLYSEGSIFQRFYNSFEGSIF